MNILKIKLSANCRSLQTLVRICAVSKCKRHVSCFDNVFSYTFHCALRKRLSHSVYTPYLLRLRCRTPTGSATVSESHLLKMEYCTRIDQICLDAFLKYYLHYVG